MPNQLKAALYVAAAAAVVTVFFSCLRPYLLQNPPNPVALAILGLSIALMLYAVVYGPVLIMRLHYSRRPVAQRILNQSFWVFIIGALLGIVAPSVPAITPAAFGCFALIAMMLSTAARYAPRVTV